MTFNKYGAKPVVVCKACGLWHQKGPFEWRGACINCRATESQRFASQLEAKRYAALNEASRRGEISDLQLQPRLPIVINGMKICTVVGDFSYLRDGVRHYEDAKGTDLPMSRLKRKLAHAVHGVVIEIVK